MLQCVYLLSFSTKSGTSAEGEVEQVRRISTSDRFISDKAMCICCCVLLKNGAQGISTILYKSTDIRRLLTSKKETGNNNEHSMWFNKIKIQFIYCCCSKCHLEKMHVWNLRWWNLWVMKLYQQQGAILNLSVWVSYVSSNLPFQLSSS